MNKIICFIKKRLGKIAVWTMVVGWLVNTVGRSIPIYFVDPEIARGFGNFMFYLTVVAVCFATFHLCYRAEDENWRSSAAVAIFLSFLTFVILGFINIFDGFSSFTDVNVLYVQKNDPNIKIIRQYVDSGALGDGYITVLRKDITSFLKYEKVIDTNTINKREWIKQ